MNRVEMLRRMRKLIVEHGWTQNEFSGETETGMCFCLAGAGFAAFTQADGIELTHDAVADRVSGFLNTEGLKIIKALDFDDLNILYRWNDREYRTKEDVLARIDNAIYRATDGYNE